MKKNKKIFTTILTILICAAAAVGIAFAVRKTTSGSAVMVVSADSLNYNWSFGGSEESVVGNITTDATQNVYVNESDTIDKVWVKEGDEVKKGQMLLEYDTEQAEIALAQRALELEQIRLNIEVSERNLETLKRIRPTGDIGFDLDEEEEEEPVEAYKVLDASAVPYNFFDDPELQDPNLGQKAYPYKYLVDAGSKEIPVKQAFIQNLIKQAKDAGRSYNYIQLEAHEENDPYEPIANNGTAYVLVDVCALEQVDGDLYLVFSPEPGLQATVRFRDDAGQELKSLRVYLGRTIAEGDIPEVQEREEETFEGWTTNDGTEYDFAQPVMKNLVLTQKWKKDGHFTVQFLDDQGEQAGDPLYVKEGADITEADVPQPAERDGYTFAGWYAGDEKISFPLTVTEDLVLKQKWERIQIPIPAGLTGLSPEEVKSQLVQKGIKEVNILLDSEYSNSITKGYVTRVYPADAVYMNDDVTVYVSLGVLPAIIPEQVIGAAEKDALAALSNAGLGYTVQYVDDQSVGVGCVVSLAYNGSPIGEGAEVPPGSSITVYVRGVSVPDLVGTGTTTEQVALDTLSNSGLGCTKQYVNDPNVTVGCVVSQDPAAGTLVPTGSNIVVNISGVYFNDTILKGLMGQDGTYVLEELAKMGLTGQPQNVYDPAIAAGSVINLMWNNAVLGDGAVVPVNSTVIVNVSQGPEPSQDTSGEDTDSTTTEPETTESETTESETPETTTTEPATTEQEATEPATPETTTPEPAATEPTTAEPTTPDPTNVDSTNPDSAYTEASVSNLQITPAGAMSLRKLFAARRIPLIRLLDDKKSDFSLAGDTKLIPADAKYTKDSLPRAIQSEENNLKSLQLQERETLLKYKQEEKAVEEGAVYAKMDGVVKKAADPKKLPTDGSPFIQVTGSKGLYVQGNLSETMLDKMHEGDMVTVRSWQSGMSYEAEITEISPYPSSDTYSGMYSDNKSASSYPFIACIADETASIGQNEQLQITLHMNSDSEDMMASFDELYLYKAFIKDENGEQVVYKRGSDGLLVRQVIETGDYNGDGWQILSGVTTQDYLAFPYGKEVKEGARTREGTLEELRSM